MTNQSACDFLRAFEVRRDCFRNLLELSGQQDELIDTDNYTELLVLLGHKQHVLGQIEQIGKERPELWEDWHRDRDSLTETQREDCESLLAETENMLRDLVGQENSSSVNLEQRRDAVQIDLRQLSEGEAVNEAYRDNLAPTTYRRLDVGQ